MARQRAQRRLLDRQARKLAEARWKLAMLSPGFEPKHPIAVESSSQIEPHVRGMHCPSCLDVAFQVVEHLVGPSGRVVIALCPQCGRKPRIHFAIRPPLLN